MVRRADSIVWPRRDRQIIAADRAVKTLPGYCFTGTTRSKTETDQRPNRGACYRQGRETVRELRKHAFLLFTAIKYVIVQHSGFHKSTFVVIGRCVIP